jgi:hypothetical protein
MPQNSGSRLFTKRNILGAVLVAGIAVGVYLSDLFKGFGLGDGTASKTTQESTEPDDATENTAQTVASIDSAASIDPTTPPDLEKPAAVPAQASQVVKVVIADRSYFVRSPEGDQSAELKQVVALAGAASGDEDGIRVRVYRRLSSRTTAEIALRDALVAAGITDEQTVWIANPIDN